MKILTPSLASKSFSQEDLLWKKRLIFCWSMAVIKMLARVPVMQISTKSTLLPTRTKHRRWSSINVIKGNRATLLRHSKHEHIGTSVHTVYSFDVWRQRDIAVIFRDGDQFQMRLIKCHPLILVSKYTIQSCRAKYQLWPVSAYCVLPGRLWLELYAWCLLCDDNDNYVHPCECHS